MRDHAMLEQFLLNGTPVPCGEFDARYQALEPSCYEVFRLMEGKALFLDEHYARLKATAASIGQTLPFSLEELEAQVARLAALNRVQDYNAKLVYNDFERGGTVYLFLTPTAYPTEEMYRRGVITDFLPAVRENPHAKIINHSLRDQADALMAQRGLFEAVLVNDRGEITEGSKSNLFFLRAGTLYTSPPEDVLLGVTRQRVLRLAEEAGIPVVQAPIPAERAGDFSAAFISGTSPKILPIAALGEIAYDVEDPLLRRVMALYEAEIRRSLAR